MNLKPIKSVEMAQLTQARTRLATLGVPLNNNQSAIALLACEKIGHKHDKHLIFTMPAGHGKSRVALAIVLMLAYQGHKKFTIVFNRKELMVKDKKVH